MLSAPSPNNVNVILGTVCYEKSRYSDREKWYIPRGLNHCEKLDSTDYNDPKIISQGITDKQIIFAFWIPGPREGGELTMHPQFQYMLSVLQFDIEHHDNNPVGMCKIYSFINVFFVLLLVFPL